MDEEYKTYTNRETWAAHLWINSEKNLHDDVLSILQEPSSSFYDKTDALKEYIENFCNTAIETGDRKALTICQDIGSYWRIDWEQLTKSLLEV